MQKICILLLVGVVCCSKKKYELLQAENELRIQISGSKEEKLLEAAEKGDRGKVDSLLAQGAAINAKDNAGFTPLHWAAKKGHQEVVTQLLEAGAEINAKDQQGWTPLHWAAQEGHQEIVLKLAKHAARAGSKEAIEAFLTVKPNEVYKPHDMLLLLEEAVQHNQRKIIPFLSEIAAETLRRSGSIRYDEIAQKMKNILKVAIINGSEEIVGHILEKLEENIVEWYRDLKDSTQRNKEVLAVLEAYEYLYNSRSDIKPEYLQGRDFQKILYNDQTILHLAAKTNKKIWTLFWQANPDAFGARNRSGISPLSLIQNRYKWLLLWAIRLVKYPVKNMQNALVSGLVFTFLSIILTKYIWSEGGQPIHTPIYFNQSRVLHKDS
ncbi:MAG: ankyrin repeat domain-containing protein [Cytophagales bacterium]|nr:ankyrin repeat domain-containing protein [Cytophagales bacterium]